jgi:transposase InsO family protein
MMMPLRVLNQRRFTRASIAARIVSLAKQRDAAAGPSPQGVKQRAKPVPSSYTAWRVVRGPESDRGSLFYGDRRVVAREDVDAVLTRLYDDPSTKATGRDQLYDKVKDRYVGISRRAVMRFLKNQTDWQLHRPSHTGARKCCVHQPQAVIEVHRRWQIDLVDLSSLAPWNNGQRWLLTVIDLFSKFAWVRALKRKEASHVVNGLQSVFDEAMHTPEVIQSDNGSEFIAHRTQALLARNNVKQVLSRPYNPQANGQIERFNGTLKRKLYRHMTQFETKKWLDVLPMVAANYNSSKHSTTKAKPVDLLHAALRVRESATLGEGKQAREGMDDDIDAKSCLRANDDVALVSAARANIIKRAQKMVAKTAKVVSSLPVLAVGDWVRVERADTKRKTTWSRELFQVASVSVPAETGLGLPQYRLRRADRGSGKVPERGDDKSVASGGGSDGLDPEGPDGEGEDDDDTGMGGDDSKGEGDEFRRGRSEDEGDGKGESKGLDADAGGEVKMPAAHQQWLPTRFYRSDLQRVDVESLARFTGTKPDFSKGTLFDLEKHLRSLHRRRRRGPQKCAPFAAPASSLSERSRNPRTIKEPRRLITEV